jgi:CheY-like chemotaxis protein
MISVIDTGTGIPPEVVEKVMEPFFTTKPLGQGTGLGLSIVYGFVKQSDGHIEIDSRPGHGTIVNLYFPAALTQQQTAPLLARAAPLPQGRPGEVVMVIEDDAAVRKFVVSLIISLGYATIVAKDGHEARALIDRKDRIDLLLTDIVLPNGTSGPEIARDARERLPGLKVLFMSGYAHNAVDDSTIAGETFHLLQKPFRKHILAARLRQLLDDAAP